jgi:hypothetical protein
MLRGLCIVCLGSDDYFFNFCRLNEIKVIRIGDEKIRYVKKNKTTLNFEIYFKNV